MFGRFKARGIEPPDRPFAHSEECPLPDRDSLTLEWEQVSPGYYRRTCVCGQDFWREPVADTDPAPDPAWHHPAGSECPGALTPAVAVKVERNIDDAYWITTCIVCGLGPTPWAKVGERPATPEPGESAPLIGSPFRYRPVTRV